jgi:hypothetical protein
MTMVMILRVLDRKCHSSMHMHHLRGYNWSRYGRYLCYFCGGNTYFISLHTATW